MTFDLGPFRLYRTPDTNTLNVTLKILESYPFGWEYGYKDYRRGTEKPILELRIRRLVIVYLECHKGGLEVWFMGFWWFPSWGKQWWES